MVATNTCPDRERLSRYVLGQLAGADREDVERHFLDCPSCLTAADDAIVADTLMNALRGATAVSEPGSVVQELIERVRQLHAEAGPGTNLETDTVPPHEAAPSAAGQPATQPGPAIAFLAPPQAPDEVGRLGPYRVLALLGRGGMGLVFRAEDPQLRRLVALKVMSPELASSDTFRKRFLREARTAAAIEHDHIVPIYQVGEDRGVPYLAMPLLRGESLESRLKREGKLSPAEAARIGRETARGLAAAHQRGLIHRDIKPANLWLEEETGRVKILDFGLARAAEGDGEGLSATGAVAGTPGYMAPEQVDARPVDSRADLFSLGVVLYRMLTGRLPYSGRTVLQYVGSLATETAIPPNRVWWALVTPAGGEILDPY